ncbi:MAG: aminotransferase class I/II-fold pyridoxal phosphate-dependent enzyme [Fusobacteriaceae bacterium]|jgi:aspartate aminotransferase/aromatic-amino-acid transaminase|nr:aminotransferase class I/II-fold pyridoxal phosphate-dependent enzyme [Fusobacteriaceae bacterium]
MLNARAKLKNVVGNSFRYAEAARNMAAKIGAENVINATVGMLYGEDDKLVVYPTVAEAYYKISPDDFAAYAPSFDGSADYKESIKVATLGKNYKEDFKDHYLPVIATPGGTGALTSTIRNYLEEGASVLIPEWLWEPYMNIATENEGNYVFYKIFDDKNQVRLWDLKEKLTELSKTQDTLLLVINDPCHNPTGCKLSDKEWSELLETLRAIVKEKNKDIVLIIDIAYIDYDPGLDKVAYMKRFRNLPKEILVVLSVSMSKSFTMYGTRAGAQLAITTDEATAADFMKACAHSSRATWSSVNRGAMKLVSDIVLNDEKFDKLKAERAKYVDLIMERSKIFLDEAKAVGLEILPYESGFFIAIPAIGISDAVGDLLAEEKVYTVIGERMIRIAVCSVPIIKIRGLATKVKKAFDAVKA